MLSSAPEMKVMSRGPRLALLALAWAAAGIFLPLHGVLEFHKHPVCSDPADHFHAPCPKDHDTDCPACQLAQASIHIPSVAPRLAHDFVLVSFATYNAQWFGAQHAPRHHSPRGPPEA